MASGSSDEKRLQREIDDVSEEFASVLALSSSLSDSPVPVDASVDTSVDTSDASSPTPAAPTPVLKAPSAPALKSESGSKEEQMEHTPDSPSPSPSPTSAQKMAQEFTDPIKNGQAQTPTPAPAPAAAATTRTRQLMYRILGGESITTICTEMGIAPSRFKILTSSPLFKRELSTLRHRLRDRLLSNEQMRAEDKLKVLNTVALKTFVQILTGPKAISLQLKRLVAKDIIDYNLKLAEAQKGGSKSETASFIEEAFEQAEKRKNTLQRPAHLDMAKNLPFSEVRLDLDSPTAATERESGHEDKKAVNQ